MPDIKISSFEGSEFGAYLAASPAEQGPGLVIIHEAQGVTASMRAFCDAYAAEGYIAVCPDLFWRQPSGAGDRLKGFDVEAAVRDLISTLGYVRKKPECNGKVGAIGYGLGGRLAYLLATRSDVDASAGYDAANLDKNLDEVHDVNMPLMLHFAGIDNLTSADKRAKVLRSVARNPLITTHVYANVENPFALVGEKTHDKDATLLADSRTKAFLAQNLISSRP
jgi:carboxymethylenebutenolidase